MKNFKRGAYSGAFGWMDPDGDFDFNVMIRTLFFTMNRIRELRSEWGVQ